MKKLNLFILFLITAHQLSSAQAIIVNGSVKNATGRPVHYAFVKDDKLNNATFTDTLGNFSLTVDPASKLTISYSGYTDARANAADKASWQVVLNGSGPDNSDTFHGDAKELQNAFINKNSNNTSTGVNFGVNHVFTDSKQVLGYRFAFNQWVNGYIVKADGSIWQSPNCLYNYDKINGDLFIAANLNTVTLGDKNVVRSFTLFYHDEPYTFERVTGISNKLYSRLLNSGSKYKIYKLTTTTFVKANYQSDGITSSGSTNDEYADNMTYYVLNVKTGKLQSFALKKKAIKNAFAADADKLDTYMAAHQDGNIDDEYLEGLGDAVNQ